MVQVLLTLMTDLVHGLEWKVMMKFMLEATLKKQELMQQISLKIGPHQVHSGKT